MDPRQQPTPPSPYQERILAHAKAPRHVASATNLGQRGRSAANPLCGDELDLFLRDTPGAAPLLTFRSRGCALCRASASILCETVADLSPAAAADAARGFVSTFRADGAPDPHATDGTAALLDMRRFPTRAKCVLLPWETAISLLGASG
jgi:nitrogen fixation NifU-like protein